MIDRVVDVAGVPVLLRAPDPARAAFLGANLAGFPDTDREPLATLSVVATGSAPPAGPPDDELLGLRFWEHDGGMIVGFRELVVRARGTTAVAHLPDLDDGALLEDLVAFALTWLLAAHARFVLHAGAVVRDDRAVLLLGHTGAGKSTLAVSSLEAGWRLLADDQVVLDASGAEVLVCGFHNSPAVPREIGGALAVTGAVLGDARDRAELPRAVLSTGSAPLVAVVVAAHSARDDGELQPRPATTVFPLLLQSYAGTTDPRLREQFFPVAGRLARLPAFELGHALDATVRRARAVHHLERVAQTLLGNEEGLSPDG